MFSLFHVSIVRIVAQFMGMRTHEKLQRGFSIIMHIRLVRNKPLQCMEFPGRNSISGLLVNSIYECKEYQVKIHVGW